MSEIAQTFVATYNEGKARVERSLTFSNGDEIQLRIGLPRGDALTMSLTDLNRAAMERAVQHLQELLANLPPKKA